MTTLVGQSVEAVENAAAVRGDLAFMYLGLSDLRTIGVAEARPRRETMETMNKLMEIILTVLAGSCWCFEIGVQVRRMKSLAKLLCTVEKREEVSGGDSHFTASCHPGAGPVAPVSGSKVK